VDKATNWWDACLAANLFKHDWRYGSDLEALLKKLRKELKWQGHDLDGVIVRPTVKFKNPATGDDEEKGDRITFHTVGWRSWGKTRLKVEEVNSILVGRKVKVYLVENCKGLRRGQLKYAYESGFFNRDDNTQYYVITTKVPFDTLTKTYPKLEWIKYESASVLPEPPPSTVSGVSSDVKDAKHTKGKTFTLKLNYQGHGDKASNMWDLTDGAYTDDDLWVEIEKFEPTNPFGHMGRSGFVSFAKALKTAGILKGRLLAKKKGEKFPDGVTVINAEIEGLITKLLASDPKFANKVWMANEVYHHNFPSLTGLSAEGFKKDSKLAKTILGSDLDTDHPAMAIVALMNQKFSDAETQMSYLIDRYNGGNRMEPKAVRLDPYKPAKEMTLEWQEKQLVKGWPMSRWANDNSWRSPEKEKACFEKDLVSYWETK